MLNPRLLSALSDFVGEVVKADQSVSGGDINRAFRVQSADGRPYFLKLNKAACAAMFAAERDALDALGATGAVRVPAPVATGCTDDTAWLLLEWLELQPASRASDEALGHGLAAVHRHASTSFGWHRDNTIGTTPQSNRRAMSWIDFYANERLRPQLERAGWLEQTEPLRAVVERLCAGYEPVPALLHGDLWSGNRARLWDGTPVMFDPATYYGDRETDLAMTRLFGGFNEAFYSAYNEAWPLETGHERRQLLYNLYHVLNHCNLFGGHYRQQAEQMITQLLSA